MKFQDLREILSKEDIENLDRLVKKVQENNGWGCPATRRVRRIGVSIMATPIDRWGDRGCPGTWTLITSVSVPINELIRHSEETQPQQLRRVI